MATGGRFSGSLSKGNDEYYDHCCTPCSNQDKIIEACYQCLECDEFFCGKCNDVHSKLGATSGHKVLGKDQMGKVAGSRPKKQLPTQRCHVHRGQNIEIYCADHDVICCNTCVSISHTLCGGKTYIVDAAKGIKSGKLLKTTRGSLNAALKEIKKGRDTRQKALDAQDREKTANLKQVRQFTEQLIKRIRDLERSTVDEITVKHEGLSAETVADIAALDDMISVVEEDLRKLDQSQKKSDSQVFVDIKLGQGHEAEGRKLLQEVTRLQQTGLKFALNTEIESLLSGVRSLATFTDDNKVYKAKLHGSYDIEMHEDTDLESLLSDVRSLATFTNDNKVYKAKLHGSYNVKVREDTYTCDIGGSYLLPDGTIVLADYDNKRLKRLDTSYSVTDHVDMGSQPCGVTCTVPGEMAVTMTRQKKVQFVSTGASMSLTRSFSTSDRCRAVCYSKGELFVSCGGSTVLQEGPGHVAVYDLNGTRLRTVQTDPSGQNIFSCPSHISIISDGSRVYVANGKAGIVSLDRTGKHVRTISDPSLKTAIGVCTLDNGHILVCGVNSNNVLQFDGDGRKMTELLKATDVMKRPWSLCYDGNRSTLVVTMYESDTIKVFDML